ncbi:meiotic mismatch repair protein [Aureococcus anophagefferens]|jgi:DNA excision repair protein ERCC-1|uniref:Uncharacterized protein n=2 Tax=Aureococcus anophagefferens TaxID=44056 RepID=F0YEN7_AURAN|nr:hypothetical protein AURANDRAFT_29330 [Aureococcus anophagefferens]EGB06440.1 hypothetical protein AURANDRAFT_29330 [Aureococcus anophagefferens]|eukprot:XP_009039011.1 hypothetical protein AURANDRAFT_29330 [Aureococcus anophagefferens]
MADRLLVSERQRGNPLLKHLRNVAWRFEKKLVPDYVVGEKHCAVFISIRYHLLKPSYLSRRLAELKAETWRLRVLLCHVDLDDAAKALHELNVLAVKAECTLILGHSDRECARYLECFKAYERNSAACIKDKVDGTHHAQLADALTTIKPVNKTDVATLAGRFATFRDLLRAPVEELRDAPGLGDKKVARLYDAFHVPFSQAAKRKRDAARRAADDAAVDEAGEEALDALDAAEAKRPRADGDVS